MSKRFIAMGLAAALTAALAGCSGVNGMSSGNAPPGSYCYEHTPVCVMGGVVLAGLAAGIIANSGSSNSHPKLSDTRLKQDVHPFMVADNGVPLYTYHYLGDDRLFSGALAQELLKDPRFRDAVTRDANGFYSVDYTRLGFRVINGDAMDAAGQKAEAILLGLSE